MYYGRKVPVVIHKNKDISLFTFKFWSIFPYLNAPRGVPRKNYKMTYNLPHMHF